MNQTLFGGIEFGGTKTICAIGDVEGTLVAKTTIPTTTLDETLAAVFYFFHQNLGVASVGVGSFGPLQLNPKLPNFGYIYNAPKPDWCNIDIKSLLETGLHAKIQLDTDVNCAALGEQYYGVARQVKNFVYLTLGTGIGGSLVINGQLIHGLSNLEMGHMRIPYSLRSDNFGGACIFHDDCLEGIASGYAIERRYGLKAKDVTDVNAWQLEAEYIALALNNLMMTIAPELIVIGGGLVNHPGLLEDVRCKLKKYINNYMQFPDLQKYIVQSSGETNGVLGAIKLTTFTS